MEELLQHLIKRCTAEMAFIEDQLPTGLAKDMSEYSKMCGQHFAYLKMRTIMGDLLVKFQNGEDV